MGKICAKAGVALCLVPELKHVPWNGATKWLRPDKAMIILSLRGKREDKFWFSFFHEAGHVLNDNKKNLYINDDSDDPIEKKADRFAVSVLFPDESYSAVATLHSSIQILDYAKRIGLSPGIVAGAYQFLTNKWAKHHDLIKKFVWETN
jgi:Zn-dependent peptidase ImmA (M78 family)